MCVAYAALKRRGGVFFESCGERNGFVQVGEARLGAVRARARARYRPVRDVKVSEGVRPTVQPT